MKTNIQTIFIDLDNTLYDHISQSVPPLHIQALHALKAKGYKLIMCTGRPPALVKEHHFENLIDWDGYITGIGSYVFDRNFHTLIDHSLAVDDVAQIIQYAENHGLGVIGFGKKVKFATRWDPKIQEMIDTFHFKDVKIHPWHPADHLSNLLLRPKDPLRPIPELDTMPGIVPIYMKNWVEIRAHGISKYKGIETLMNHFHEPINQYLAFGDSALDMEMLDRAEIGVVMANGESQLKRLPGIQIAPNCHDGGIYTWLKENEWI